MANPQKENGWTAFSNELLQAVIAYPFTAAEMKIVMKIARDTYGYSRKKAQISFGEISVSCCVDRRSVIRLVQGLVAKKVLFIQETPGARASNVLGLNKNYDQWERAAALNLSHLAKRNRGEGLKGGSHGAESEGCEKVVDDSGFDSGADATIKHDLVAAHPLVIVAGRPLPSGGSPTSDGGGSPTSASGVATTSYIEKEKKESFKKSRNKDRLETAPGKNGKDKKLVRVANLLDGFEDCIKSQDPRALITRLRENGYEVKRSWAAVAQARHKNNPAGYLVKALADPAYPVGDEAMEQAGFEMRKFNHY